MKGLSARTCSAAIVLLGGVLFAPTAEGQFLTAADISKLCLEGSQEDCSFYVAGVADALAGTHAVCLPLTVSVRTTGSLVTDYLRSHPQTSDYSADFVVFQALASSFPCP